MKHIITTATAIALLMCGCNKENYIGPDDPGADQLSPYQTKVFEYLPAPGQFINDTALGGFTGTETTPEAAAAYAEQRLAKGNFVSLGSFGGYIVVGFDHSITNSNGGYDIAIMGNAMEKSNEPGIVWVMCDTNHNSLPDDQWYELRGSETGNSQTIHNYSVTYHRPASPKSPVAWTDSEGNSGTVDYLEQYHKQDYYYPLWVSADSYTLTGTRLKANNRQDPETGNWENLPFAWGYADNLGSDAVAGNEHFTAFKISNAITSDGQPANLTHIDFVKVQQGVLAKSGWIGENSCEVMRVADYRMLFD